MRDDSEKVPALLTDYILKGKHTAVLSHFYISVTMLTMYKYPEIKPTILVRMRNAPTFKHY